MSITVFGSINIDMTTYVQRMPAAGETLHGDRYALGLGGKGCNQAIAAVRLGAEATLIGRVGQDEFGARALKELKAEGLSTAAIVEDPDSETGIAVISVDAHAQNSITVIGGANMAITADQVAAAQSHMAQSSVLMVQLETPLDRAQQAMDLARAAGATVILDPAPAPAAGLSTSILAAADWVTPNETETGFLTGLTPTNELEAREAALLLRQKGVRGAVIKLGAQGVYYQTETEDGFIPPFSVKSVDSVAAGDCFNGGFAYALDAGQSIAQALRFAAACGALATTKPGASAAAPTRAEVERLIS